MSDPTAMEQLMLELVNRLRSDPQGEYDRLINSPEYAEIASAISYFGVSLSALESQLAAYGPVAPLAWNASLHAAASAHNDEMIAQDTQAHVLPGEDGLGTRFEAAGYTGWNRIAENIYAFSKTVFYGHAGFVIDWGYDDDDYVGGSLRSDWKTNGDGIQDNAGHRVTLLSANYSEIGIAITEESNSATKVGPLVITQDLGHRFAYQAQFVGSVIDDLDNDDFYDIGEGLGGVNVTFVNTSGASWSTVTWASGGYQIAVPAGEYTVTFSGGGLPGDVVVNATLGSVNAYLSVEAADAGVGASIFGTAGSDVLDGTAYGDIIDGGGGADTMRGGAGDDVYYVDNAGDLAVENGGAGHDTVHASVNFTLGAHVEDLVLSGAASVGRGNGGNNTISASAGNDNALYGDSGRDVLNGNAGADRLLGGAHKDTLLGNNGNDELLGGSGNDRLFGQKGDDTLSGGQGRDRLDGAAGRDIMTGGDGRDTFVFKDGHFAGLTMATADRITDFTPAQGDRINLAGVDADIGTAGDQAFAYIGTAAFSHSAGELRYDKDGTNTLLLGDTDGDGIADLAIRLDGDVALSVEMFLL